MRVLAAYDGDSPLQVIDEEGDRTVGYGWSKEFAPPSQATFSSSSPTAVDELSVTEAGVELDSIEIDVPQIHGFIHGLLFTLSEQES